MTLPSMPNAAWFDLHNGVGIADDDKAQLDASRISNAVIPGNSELGD